MRNNNYYSGVALAVACAAFVTTGHAQEENYRTPKWLQASMAAQSTDRFIVKFKTEAAQALPSGAVRATALTASAGQALRHVRSLGEQSEVVALAASVSNEEARNLAKQLQLDPRVEYAEPDYKMFPVRNANDPGFSPGINFAVIPSVTLVSQWYLSETLGGINAPSAWDVVVGSPSTVVAVIDTGVLNHSDLAGRMLAGYDFIGPDGDGSLDTANDGNGRDADATDPGNWITPQEAGTGNFASCGADPSDWHGTHVAGLIAANADNGQNIAGINWATKIMPVRVLGKCGGYVSDIVDGMRWSVGMAVSGVPANANRANIVNLSLGIPSDTASCSRTMQSAINDVLARGATIVVAAGNGSVDSTRSIPANCAGVISVAASLRNGQFASSYSNRGASVTLAAPGGFIPDPLSDFGVDGILSINDRGETRPLSDNATAVLFGTSFSTAIVSGVASLLVAVNPNLSPTQIKAILQSTARLPSNPNDKGLDCVIVANRPCQQYVVDAAAAVLAASQPLLTILDRNRNPVSLLDFGTNVSGATSAPQTIIVRNDSAAPIRIERLVIAGQHQDDFNATTTCDVLFDLAPGAECQVDVTFTARANNLRTADVIVASNVDLPVALSGSGVAAPPSGGDSGGGGGGCTFNPKQNLDLSLLLLLATSLFTVVRRRNA
jgi:serine protease